jgi:site-specific DNA recombinase
MTDVNHRLARLYDAIETGKLNLDDVVVRIRELRQRQEQLQSRKILIENQMSDRKVEIADLETISMYVDDLQALLNQGSLTERRAFIRSFVKEIKVTGGEAILSYFPPNLPEKLVVERAGVLPTVQYSGRYWARTSDLCDDM